eukprot:CAMPEP_0198423004 /NCGR_PEP_ID=MMETSP1452-20131203/2778_1 /TAXON_ID=1181717 /ORGANISM="Synchroma pusillum, Strain CCMP3072" /LENGTH=51 /DNA_ID=CAMNT_0044143281 /DNA_START=13 /DNA_END=168 /DNA_ORIENTATION=+
MPATDGAGRRRPAGTSPPGSAVSSMALAAAAWSMARHVAAAWLMASPAASR